MKLKGKIRLIFIILIIAPILVTVIIGFLGTRKIRGIYNEYYIRDNAYHAVFNPMIAYERLNNVVEQRVETVIADNPDRLLNQECVNELETGISEGACQIVVVAGDRYVVSNGDVIDAEFFKQINMIDNDRDDKILGGIYLAGEYQRLINVIDVHFSDGTDGNVYIITRIEHVVPRLKNLLILAVICLISIVVATSLCMSMWLYKSIVNPISQLKLATNNIKEGNLDFTIENKRKDEIGELCNDFEDMRKRLKESTEEKIANDRQSKELISNISHDLKTPLTAIKGYCEGIQDGIADTPEKMERYIKTIYNKTIDMTKLIDELTLYSKIDSNKIPYNFNKINVKEYFDDCVDEVKTELEAKGIELGYFNYTDSSTLIIADAEQLKRVINNIISNSVKYMKYDRKGIINIRIKDADDFVEVELEDNGKGIAAKDVQYIFDRFYRTDSSRNSSQGGSGIGLSIVKKIINDHGGQIWATSKEDIGTTMHFVLRKYIEDPRR